MIVSRKTWALTAAFQVVIAVRAFAAIEVIQPDGVSGKDSLITSIAISENYGNGEYLTSYYGGTERTIGLIEFDLSAIPSGATINSATLSLFHEINASGGITYSIFRITSAWNEGTVTFESAPSVDGIAAASTTIGDYSFNFFRDWDVSSLVAGWVDGSFANFGMWFEEVPIGGLGYALFHSSDVADPSRRPILTIDYTVADAVPEAGSLCIWSAIFGLSTYGWQRRRVA